MLQCLEKKKSLFQVFSPLLAEEGLGFQLHEARSCMETTVSRISPFPGTQVAQGYQIWPSLGFVGSPPMLCVSKLKYEAEES